MGHGFISMRMLLKCWKMIDNIKGSFRAKDPEYYRGGICSFPTINKTTGSIYFSNDPHFNGMNVKFNPDTNVVTFQNSIHKFYKKNNFSDFNKKEILEAVLNLSRYLGIKPDEETLKITQIEIGVNVNSKFSPYDFLDILTKHKNAPFRHLQKAKGSSLDYGKKAQHIDYHVKFYDKFIQTYLTHKKEYTKEMLREECEENLLRYELQYTRTSSFKTLKNLSSLYQDDFLLECKQKLTTQFNHIQYKRLYDSNLIDYKSLCTLCCYENSEFQDLYFSKYDIINRKKITRAYKILKDKSPIKEDIFPILDNQIKEKIELLISV